ncbi:Protein CBG27901 [Caenorhabditis briggsae]|uniref:Uncharacterized protein n=2 Tax=Caenorhabditis briggsae TaxID=6238 RepID=A0AAE8ZUR1_CAEBR|nr:Protein CBG27901 [Caenorhabditis briggsae]ULT83570.1 hypothetical protein L3Y34_012660 [Caenorhabditis briggsae]UMM42845.1 hypothetical protein L5515_018518 [Caenorhabditis briggsae]CAR98326.1 Protein CBG27901 [Caenorhabditis briggsae]
MQSVSSPPTLEIQPKLEPLSPIPTPPPAEQMPSPPPQVSKVPMAIVKPEFSLVPVRSGVPIYHLVHEGPAQPGWELKGEWTTFKINEPIYYKDDYFMLKHNH